MANWKKVLVSGSNIEVATISGSSLNLSGISAGANQFLTTTNEGTLILETVSQGDNAFDIMTVGSGGLAGEIDNYSTAEVLRFATSSNHGFGFDTVVFNDGGGQTHSINLITPQDLSLNASPTFNAVLRSANQKMSFEDDGSVHFKAGDTTYEVVTIGPDGTGLIVNPDGDTLNTLFKVSSPTAGDNSGTPTQGTPQLANLFLIDNTIVPLTAKTGSVLVGGSTGESFDPNTFTISGSTNLIGPISASSLPADTTSTSLIFADAGGVLGVGSVANIATAISGAAGGMTASLSASVAGAIGILAQDIIFATNSISNLSSSIGILETSESAGFRVQTLNEAVAGNGSITTTTTTFENIKSMESMSFVGGAGQIFVSGTSPDNFDHRIHLGLEPNVTMSNLQVTNIEADLLSGSAISASNLEVDTNITLGGTLFFQGNNFIQNDTAVLSGSNIFGSGSGNTHVFTGSVIITGGLDVNNGDFEVSGSTTLGGTIASTTTVTGHLTASGNISSSNLLFASLSFEEHNNVVVYDTSSGEFHVTGSEHIQGQNVIGPASDGQHDGLLDFNDNTPTGDAIDSINTILEGLAPGPAPDVQSLGNDESDGVAVRLSFGPLNPITSPAYTNVTSGDLTDASGQTNSPVNTTFLADAALTVGGTIDNHLRLGAFGTLQEISGPINPTVAEDSGTFINFSASSFGNGNLGTLKLFVNDESSPKTTIDLTSTTAAITQTSTFYTLEVSAEQNANFPATGNSLAAFKHRSGSFKVATGGQTQGWNYARVIHTVDGTDKTTNYVEWVNDTSAQTLSATADPDFPISITGDGVRVNSGVKYFTSFTGNYKAAVNNIYRNVHSNNSEAIKMAFPAGTLAQFTSLVVGGGNAGIAGPDTSNNSTTAPSIDLPFLNTSVDNCHLAPLSITASFENGSDRAFCALNSVNAFKIHIDQALHPLVSNLTDANEQSIDGFLFDNRNDDSTLQKETFVTESTGRVPSSSYDTQTLLSDAIGTFDSTVSLAGNTDLLMFPGVTSAGSVNTVRGDLVYPRNAFGAQSANFGGITNAPASNPNYSSVSGLASNSTRTFYRAFKNNGGSSTNIDIFMRGSGTLVPVETALGSSTTNFHVRIKIPGVTKFMDLGKAPGATDTLQFDNQGCASGTPISALTNNSNADGNFGVFVTANGGGGGPILADQHLVVEVTMGQNFTGFINEIRVFDV